MKDYSITSKRHVRSESKNLALFPSLTGKKKNKKNKAVLKYVDKQYGVRFVILGLTHRLMFVPGELLRKVEQPRQHYEV